MSFPWRILWDEKRVGECVNKAKYFYVHAFNISNSHAVTKFLFPLTIFTKHTILDVWLVLATPLVLLTIFVTLTIIIILITLNIGSHLLVTIYWSRVHMDPNKSFVFNSKSTSSAVKLESVPQNINNYGSLLLG